MKKTYYEKIGNDFIPVAEYDDELHNSFSEGFHLVHCKPNSTLRKFDVDPDNIKLIAAGEFAKDAICKTIMHASTYKPSKVPVTSEQVEAWDNMQKAYGDDFCCLQGASAQEVADAAVNELIEQANELFNKSPAVKKAYEKLMTLVELTRNHK